MDVGRATIHIDGHKLACTDKEGTLLSTQVQVIKTIKVPARKEFSVACRLTALVKGTMGLVEDSDPHRHSNNAVAACLVKPDECRRMLVRIYNPSVHSIPLKSGKVIGRYISIEEPQVASIQAPTKPAIFGQEGRQPMPHRQYPIPEHIKELYKEAIHTCQTQQECKDLAVLLTTYGDVFSSGPNDVGLTNLVQHSIPDTPGTKPIKQAPRRLGPKRAEEV